MQGPFDASLYATETPVPSYWEAATASLRPDDPRLTNDIETDVAIIGGGYTGLGAALTLTRELGVSAVVLEAGPIGFGASGRNAGQCSIDCTKLGLQDVFRQFGAWEARRYYVSQFEAIHWLRALCHEEGIDAQRVGEATWVAAHSPAEACSLQQFAEVLARGLDADLSFHRPEAFAERVMHLPFRRDGRFGGMFGAMRVAPGFGVNPLALCLGLARAARRHGAMLYPFSEVRRWTVSEQGRHRHHLLTATGSVRARWVILATNGFTPEGLRMGEAHNPLMGTTFPVLSNIIVTRPLGDLLPTGPDGRDPVADSWRLLHYWRQLPDGRLLLGMRGDTRGDAAGAERMRAILVRRLAEMVPGLGAADVAYFWRGPICATWSLRPAVGLTPDRSVGYAFGYHGNGVNSAAFCGAMLARALIEGREGNIPAVYRGPAQPFPLPWLRPLYLRATLAAFGAGDQWDRWRNAVRLRKTPLRGGNRLDSRAQPG